MANEDLHLDGDAIKAAASSLTTSKTKSKAGLSPRKTTAKKTAAKKTTTKKTTTANKDKSSKTKASSTSTRTKKSGTTKKTTSSKGTTTRKSTGSTKTRSSGLEADLKKNPDETYTRAELMDGIRLAVQEAGMDAIRSTLLALVTEKMPVLGNKLEKEATDLIIRKTKSEYSKCSAAQKKSLRALIHWIRNDFDLGQSLDFSELTSGFAGNVASSGSGSTPLNLKPLNEK